jgi:transposase
LADQLTELCQQATEKGFSQVRLWSPDESRCGLLPIIRQRITAKGVQPVLKTNFEHESFYLFGAVEPVTGEQFILELPHLNTANFQLFVDHFSRQDPASFHLFLADNATFHTAKSLQMPANVGLLFLPAYSPELNPIERFWRDLKDWLSRHHPQSLDELSGLIISRLKQYTTTAIKSLTAFNYLLSAWHEAIA